MEQNFGIGRAVKLLHEGKALVRKGWNGKDQFLKLQIPDENSKMTEPYVYMKIVKADQPQVLIPWLCSQADLLATDWHIVE